MALTSIGPDGLKRCTRCGQRKPPSAFNRRGGSTRYKHHLKSRCKGCETVVMAEYRVARPEYRAEQHAREIERCYGLEPGEYAAMLERQGGVCAVCGQDNRKRRLVVDHCHTRGTVRGLLCDGCNKSAGLLHDDVDRIRRLADYLENGVR